MSFKLLAIRPLKDCNPKFLKNLEENRIYQFYNDYEFIEGKAFNKTDYLIPVSTQIVKTIKEKKLNNLYGENINISAIVGKNGSGKSAIIELLIASILKISLLLDEEFINPESLYYKTQELNSIKKYDKDVKKLRDSLSKDLANLKVEIYYEHYAENSFTCKNNKIIVDEFNSGKVIRCFLLENNDLTIKDQINTNKNGLNDYQVYYYPLKDFEESLDKSCKISKEKYSILKDFFYSIIVNYSHYGFNSNEIGEWIRSVFHKNDGYQLPIVINPYREKGNIDINSEKVLAKSRFLVNILQQEKLRTIQKNKTVSYITIQLDDSKFIIDKKRKSDLRITNTDEEKLEILKLIFNKFYITVEDFKTKNHFFSYALDYILIKLKKMTRHVIYNDYERCFEETEVITLNDRKIDTFKIINNKLLENFIDAILTNFSHLTEKLRQALFFITYCYIEKDSIEINGKAQILKIDKLYNWINNSYKLHFESIINRYIEQEDLDYIKKLKNNTNYKKFNTTHSLPSFFKIEYYFENKINKNNFSSLSSGEKQKIYSIHSIIYHLKNLISIEGVNHITLEKDKAISKRLIHYKCINIIFDEIELYAHPEFQRSFIKELLDSLQAINLEKNYLNILFITHSPFILSDIPKQNILYLKTERRTRKGQDVQISIPQSIEDKKSFGANITDLLADSFFIEDGLMGDFAKEKIRETIAWLTNKERDESKKEHFKKIIEIIDEPLLNYKLKEMYFEIYPKDYDKEEDIKKLIEKADKLGYTIQKK